MKKRVKFLFFTMTLLLTAVLFVTLCAAESDFSAITSTSTHSSMLNGVPRFSEKFLIDGDHSATASIWVSADGSKPAGSKVETNLTPSNDVILTLTLSETQSVSGVTLWPHMGYNNEEAGQYFPRGFDISTSSDGGNTYTLVKEVRDYIIGDTVTGQPFTFGEQKNVTHIKIQIRQMGWYPTASNGYYNSFAKLSEIELYDPLVDVKAAASEIMVNHLEVDYTEGKLVMPSLDLYDVEIYSSSDTSVIALDGTLNASVSTNVDVVLKVTDKSDSSLSTLTDALTIEIEPQKISATKLTITDAEATVNHSTYNASKLFDGKLGNPFWAGTGTYTGDIDVIVTLEESLVISYVDMYTAVALNGNVNSAPENFAVYVSDDKTTWTECLIKSNQPTGAGNTANRLWLNGINVGKYVKITIFGIVKPANVHIGELEVFGIKEITPSEVENVAASIGKNHLEIDYTNGILILPKLDGYTVTVNSSSDTSVIGLDGSVDINKNTTVKVSLTVTNNNDGTLKANTKELDVAVCPVQQFIEEKTIVSATANSNHSTYNSPFLTDGSAAANRFWASADGAQSHQNIEIVADMGAVMPISCVDIYPARNSSGVLAGAKDFTVYTSETGEDGTYVECLVKTNQAVAADGSVQRLWLNGLPEARYIKIHITKFADGAINVHIGELKVYTENAKTAEECVNELRIKSIAYGDAKIEILGDTEAFEVTITQSSNEEIIDTDGTITFPENDTEVTLTIMAKSLIEGTTAEKDFTVTVKSEAKLLAEKIAKSVNFVELPANDATAVTIPTIDNSDYEISLVKSDNEAVISLDGAISRPEETTGVYLTFRISLKSDSTVYADTKPLLVPVYKPYDPIVMTADEIAAIRADFEAKSFGVFVHYVSEFYNGGVHPGSTRYVDGTPVLTVDPLAEGFNAEQFAKDMNDFGAEWVVFTAWHGDARTLFPSMTNKRWRDDRREVDEDGNWVEELARKTYSDRDVIDELITALDKYDIDLHLYTHSSDGNHDFTPEDKILTGSANSANYYEIWNKYNNELHYELCERYRDRIKGLWVDGHLAGLELSGTTKRLEEFTEACTSIYPAMLLTLNGGLASYDYDNIHNGNSTTTHSIDRHWGKLGDIENGFGVYMSWEINPGRKVDYTTLRYSKNHSATVLANGGWFTVKAQTSAVTLDNTVDMFRYIVALKSKTTMGGFLASTGFYPVREQDLTSSYPIANGDYWCKGIRDQLVELNEKYMTPVAEAVRNTIPSTAYLSHNDDYVAMLEWGVATESRDGKNVYLHVLHAPENGTLTLPATADGSKLLGSATVLGFDGSKTEIEITALENGGYSITLPEGMSWSEVDTVIKAERETASFSVDETEITLTAEGDNAVITPSADKVIFVSSDESVVTVDENGIITAIGEGTATITVLNGYYANNIDKNDLDAYNPNYTVFVEVTVLYDEDHTHNYGGEWIYDGNIHYHQCACGAKTDIAVHTGGSATCKTQAECDVCGASYGELSHHGGTATCSEKAICDTCGEPYGDYAPHNQLVFDAFSGRFICVECGNNCEHTSWTDAKCNICGTVCTHDWNYDGNVSACRICGKKCSAHGTFGLDFKCAVCGRDTGATNSFGVGGSVLTDSNLWLNYHHKFNVSFDVTFGSTDTAVNVKDESRSDNIYYSTSEAAVNKSEYFSVFTWINNTGGGDAYTNVASLWIDQATNKLYLVKNNDKNTKICEVETGVAYTFDVEFEPKNGKFTLKVSDNGNEIATYNGTFGAVTKQLTKSQLRFGESVNSKQIHVQKIAFDEIYIDFPEYENGVCVDCSVECAHIFNMGGHCVFCGEFGNAITFADGANGGGNIYDTDNDGKLDNNGTAMTSGNRVYTHNTDTQLWDYRDEAGMLLGRDYVFSGKFTFNEYTYDSTSGAGQTRLIIWADSDVNYTNTKFALYLFSNNGKLEIGPDENDPSTRFALESGREYDIRVAVRSEETSEGVFSNVAEVYIDSRLIWTRSFTLTETNGMAIRVGDHTPRQTRVKYDVAKDFGIRCLDSNISFIGTQEKENANYENDSNFDIRFIFALDDLYLNDVGVKVEAEMSGGALYDDANGTLTASSSRTVLNGVMADGKVYKPGAYGAGYGGHYLALAVTRIPLDTTATYTFTLTPYVTNHGEEPSFSETSHKITVSFTDYKMNIAYEKAE